jgi:hypothetical protein
MHDFFQANFDFERLLMNMLVRYLPNLAVEPRIRWISEGLPAQPPPNHKHGNQALM